MPICIFGHLKSVLKLDFHSWADLDIWKNNYSQKSGSGFMVKTYLELKGVTISLAI